MSPLRLHHPLLLAAAALAAPAAHAQVAPQNLAVAFVPNIVAAPLSDWLPAGLALMLAAATIAVMRRRGLRGSRLLGWALAVAAGAVTLAATGLQMIPEARAVIAVPQISLVTSPGSVNVSVALPATPLQVTVTNNSGNTARITDITLAAGNYSFGPSQGCQVGTTLGVGGTCTITLVFLAGA